MRILALDLSKTASGWARWGKGEERASYGHWVLGSEFTARGRVYTKLHQNLAELHSVAPFDAIFFEEAISPAQLQGHTNAMTIKLAAGLGAHVESFAEAYSMRIVREVNQATWRRDFLGKLPRHLRSADLKAMAMQRARQLGFRPQRHDEAEAIGILDHACLALDLTPPWAAQLHLRSA